ncbi:hypothetical protein G7068_13690 [Leucobacter viscericola]|uniref:Uncharacterized protein n=1 Tax=Leucobacter viscericola TaxID=2714935 RepID=A0A6G7XID3_9MICO|nr:hypothetical protein [Leucobacter viscericola]QIK64131.1 hypothetical protein G7068_13690 [Leucobacter viscericola]
MSEGYTPTTEQVRSGYASDPVGEYHDPINAAANERAAARGFDRWLAEVERAAAEKAWGDLARIAYPLYEAAEAAYVGHKEPSTLLAPLGKLAAQTNPYQREEEK